MFELRQYQKDCIDAIYRYWQGGGWHSLAILPTGSGKSLVIAALCKELLSDYSEMRIGIATHVRELIAQDYAELKALWPAAPAGIYSAGIGRRDRHAKILFMGIQSARARAAEIGAIDLMIIDEAHLVSHDKGTGYRTMLAAFQSLTPDMRVVGLTATGFRLDTGRLDVGEDRLFDDIVYEANVKDLIEAGWLCKLISKKTLTKMDVEGVGRRGGEFITSELEVAVDQDHITRGACREIIDHATVKGDRRAWLAFCVTIDHARHVCAVLREMGASAECVFGETPKVERDRIIADFREGGFQCLVSVMVLGIGFNVPHVDLICLLRPTASAGLFVQQVGRGLRNAPGKANCLVLDFAANTRRHGPIDTVIGAEVSGPQSQVCPGCDAYVAMRLDICPHCGHVLRVIEEKPPALPVGHAMPKAKADEDTDIVSDNEPTWRDVRAVNYFYHTKRNDPAAPPTLRVEYICGFDVYSEWVCFEHRGYARQKAADWWAGRVLYPYPPPQMVEDALKLAREGVLKAPARIKTRPDGRFTRIMDYEFTSQAEVA